VGVLVGCGDAPLVGCDGAPPVRGGRGGGG
jgi:hypothetical protein